jgi:alkanesulfonate monooxygenase SsuD/methylene tetrahydromethanopterin reductase-like flavin-dependent oxidoreductase (luciferase family)
MILGVGVGWMEPEFQALGVAKSQRGKLSDETLRVIRHLFNNQEAKTYQGQLVNFPAFVFEPRPACPPIWVGGNGEAAIRRTVEFGDGWHPMLPAEKLKPALSQLRAKLKAKGRSEEIEVVVRRGLRFGDIPAAKANVDAEREAGASYYILDLGRYEDENEFAAKAETFISKIAE